MIEFSHESVLIGECMRCLCPQEGGVFIDGTLGGGGHSEAMLALGASVIGIDRDADAIRAADARLSHFAPRYRSAKGNYADARQILDELGVDRADGALLDLGVSSYQLDAAHRGFSYHEDAPLDMRMDAEQTLSAAEVVNRYSEAELARILREYGQEKWAARIAQFIVQKRPLATTGDLVAAIDAAVPKRVRAEQGIHPARRTFQAIRIEVNGELARLHGALDALMGCLKPGGRLAVITFHSLEDRIVKNAFRAMENPCVCPPGFPVCVCGRVPVGKVITRRPILPCTQEIERNPRARSAKLRCVEHT